MTFGEEGYTAYGTTIETAAQALDEAGADVIGLNCSVGPSSMLIGVERLAATVKRPVSALPNAGLPRVHASADSCRSHACLRQALPFAGSDCRKPGPPRQGKNRICSCK